MTDREQRQRDLEARGGASHHVYPPLGSRLAQRAERDRYRKALTEIAAVEPSDVVLDPWLPIRIASEALRDAS